MRQEGLMRDDILGCPVLRRELRKSLQQRYPVSVNLLVMSTDTRYACQYAVCMHVAVRGLHARRVSGDVPFYLVYPPIYLSTYLPIYLSTHLPIYLSTYLPIYLSTYLSPRFTCPSSFWRHACCPTGCMSTRPLASSVLQF